MPTDTRRLRLASVPNARDLGGLGAVRPGRVLRSVDLSRMTPEDAQVLSNLGVGTALDLRTRAERERAGYTVDGIVSHHIDVLADDDLAQATSMAAFLSDPDGAREFLRSGRGPELMHQAYRSFVILPSARTGYGDLVRFVATADSTVLIHCTAGKDRTGWAAAVLLSAVGVDRDGIVADYLQTNEDLLPVLRPLFEQVAANGLDPDLLLPVIGVREEYLQTAFDQVTASFGSLAGYFHEGLGLTDADLAQLNHRLTSR